MRIVVLDSYTTDLGDTTWPGLRALGDVTVFARTPPDLVLERCAEADAILVNKVLLPADTLAALPRLRYIGLMSTGVNVVDMAAARARGLAVTNVPAYSTESVAELVFAMILHFAFRPSDHDRAVKAGAWARSPDFCFYLAPLRELAGKNLVVLGQGAIGRAVGRIGAAFGMKVIAAAVPGSTTQDRVPLMQALPSANVVTLHCPLTRSTQGLVGRDFLAALPRHAILINTSRGPVVDQAALLEALGAGHLAGVGLDVLEREPPAADHPLLAANAPWANRLLVTPHIGWGTVEARGRLVDEICRNLAAFAAGQRRNRVD